MLPTSSHITLLQNIANQAMPETATITVVTLVDDGRGGQTETTQDLDPVSCRIDPMPSESPMLKTYADRLGTRTPYQMVCPVGTSIEAGNRVVITGDPLTYEVLGTFPGHSNQIHMVCLIVAVDP